MTGKPAITLVKIRTDMPWPTPLCVISSASHMTTTVPAVNVITIRSTRGTVKSGMRSTLSGTEVPEQATAAVVERVGQTRSTA